MALTHSDIIRPRRRRLPGFVPQGVTGEFARAALIGGFGVAALSLVPLGAAPGAVAVAVAGYGLATVLAGRSLHRGYPHQRLGLCNCVTLARFVLVCALLAALLSGSGPSWAFFALALTALSLDGVDGWLARREGLVSGFGGRFDMEVDSVLALVLALNAALETEVGLAAALLGLPRYAFGIAGLALPWLRGALPQRFSRKAVCVGQLAVLIALQAPILPPVLAASLVPVVAAALLWSFATDVAWLWRRRV
jgi:phosphatidylglycerophosphate synthase